MDFVKENSQTIWKDFFSKFESIVGFSAKGSNDFLVCGSNRIDFPRWKDTHFCKHS